jgi:hypothetical protein
MAELQQRAATKPADPDRARLVRENAELRKQVADLMDQVSKLQAQLVQLQQAKTATATRPAAKELKKGMTLAEVEQALKATANLQGADDDGTSLYTINQVVETTGDGQYTPLSVTYHRYTLHVRDGKVTAYSMQVANESHRPAALPR